jgi:hypothetical protein
MPPRNDIETTSGCPLCGTAFTRVRRQRYCSPACRQAAWRGRSAPATQHPPAAVTPQRTRREITIYQCAECDARYLGEQWCPDCQRPCIRIDYGGLCPHCDEPVAIKDLTDQHV